MCGGGDCSCGISKLPSDPSVMTQDKDVNLIDSYF